ncbi:hypothetical protein SAMN02745166_01577 [Prosthecobacter debontii]|uniref:Uncharacterized protein n=1 Tax=Prosthecobacter debontii TaxID=48467 RepID=A0A1T4XII4_9BACT|nr:hypothetical protein SAMN02745166_01577 [Prosthecobacter debontii]
MRNPRSLWRAGLRCINLPNPCGSTRTSAPSADQGQPRIWLETHALCVILQLVETGQVEMVRSPFHDLETARNPWESRRLWVQQCLDLAKVHVPLSQDVKSRALALEALHVGPMDSRTPQQPRLPAATFF